MFSALGLTNFKSLRNVNIDLKPITILLGKNSSGKSTFLQSLLLLKQTIDSRDLLTPLVPRGNFVDLGSYQDIIYGHKDKDDITFSIDFNLSQIERRRLKRDHYKDESGYAYNRYGYMYFNYPYMDHKFRFFEGTLNLKATFSYNKKTSSTVLNRLDYSRNNTLLFSTQRISNSNDLFSTTCKYSRNSKEVEIIFKRHKVVKFFKPDVFPIKHRPEIRVVNGPEYKRYPRDLVEQATYDIARINNIVEAEMKAFSDDLIHIEPVRENPKRTYIHSGEKKYNVGPRGEAAVDVLYVDNKIHHGQLTKETSSVLRWLKRLDIASGFDFPDLLDYAYLFRLKHPSMGFDSSISDYGFGLSQVLPIIVQGFYSSPGSILLLEQPEIHLHPKAQSDLAEMLVEIANRKVTLIIESHSEHIIERLQLLVAKNPELNKMISILLFKMGKNGTTVSSLELNTNGKRLNWPKEFVDGFLNGGFIDALELEKESMKTR